MPVRRRAKRTVVADGSAADGEEGSSSKNQRETAVFKRTKICKFHLAGVCSRGDSCNFAHSQGDLEELPDLSKTKLCMALVKAGGCRDAGCRYAHAAEELRPVPDSETGQVDDDIGQLLSTTSTSSDLSTTASSLFGSFNSPMKIPVAAPKAAPPPPMCLTPAAPGFGEFSFPQTGLYHDIEKLLADETERPSPFMLRTASEWLNAANAAAPSARPDPLAYLAWSQRMGMPNANSFASPWDQSSPAYWQAHMMELNVAAASAARGGAQKASRRRDEPARITVPSMFAD